MKFLYWSLIFCYTERETEDRFKLYLWDCKVRRTQNKYKYRNKSTFFNYLYYCHLIKNNENIKNIIIKNSIKNISENQKIVSATVSLFQVFCSVFKIYMEWIWGGFRGLGFLYRGSGNPHISIGRKRKWLWCFPSARHGRTDESQNMTFTRWV